MIIGILISLIALSGVIIVHELGHMIVARLVGIGVYEFSIGMGPLVIGRKFRGIQYSIRLFPVGGFVQLAGMEGNDDRDNPSPVSYHGRPLWARFLTICSGSFANILLGWIVYLSLFLLVGSPQASTLVGGVLSNSPAAHGGIVAGDVIRSVNHQSVASGRQLIDVLQTQAGQPIAIGIERNGNARTVFITPTRVKNRVQIGVQLGSVLVRKSIVRSVIDSYGAVVFQIKSVYQSIYFLATGRLSLHDVAGPVGIIQMSSYQYQHSGIQFFVMIAVISIGLGVVNLLPFPVLDGGHVIAILLHAIRKKPLSIRVESWILGVGTALLVGLMVLIVVNDIVRWPNRTQVLSPVEGK